MRRATPYVCLGCGRDFGRRWRLQGHTAEGGPCARPERWAALQHVARRRPHRRCGACKEEFLWCEDYLVHFHRDPVCRLWAAAWPELHQAAQQAEGPDTRSEASGEPAGFLPCPGCGRPCRVWGGDELYALGVHLVEAPSCYHALLTETQQVFLDGLWHEKKTEKEYQEALAERGWA